MFTRNSKNKHQFNKVQKDSVFINKKTARGQVQILIFFKIIIYEFQVVTDCKMLSNRFSNNINNKDQIRSLIFLIF